MKEISLNDFLKQSDDYIMMAAHAGEAYIIKTTAGNAVLVCEDDYKIMQDAFKQCVNKQ